MHGRSNVRVSFPLMSRIGSPRSKRGLRFSSHRPKPKNCCTRTPCGNSTTFYEDRRARIYSLTSGIPAILWYTVAVGALINMILLWLFDLRPNAHWLLGGLISFYLGTVIAVIALMDRPYRGELGLSPEAFQIIYHQVMHQ